ncbi:hypothetical protein [Arenimonas sp.]|uniref:hypothetical protein n=1 Tax=Arenimonas sp. TaxID=1872635 RepID=UPI0035AE1E13
MTRVLASLAMLVTCSFFPQMAKGYEVALELGFVDSRAIHLRVGERARQDENTNYTDGYGIPCVFFVRCSGGSPTAGRGGAVNTVSVTVPASQAGNGTALAMSGDSTASGRRSSYDGRSFCGAGEIYIGGFVRKPGNASPAALTVQAVDDLRNGARTIPASQISWSTGDAHISGGTLGTTPVQIASFPANHWVEACMSFTYANSDVHPAGTYVTRATYTLAQP